MDGELSTGDQELGGVPLTVIPAPGHAPNQMMIAGGGACFVADAVFAPEIAAKHVIPFYVDIDQTLASLEALSRLDGQYVAFVPGHGMAVPSITSWAAENTARLAEIRATVKSVLGTADDAAGILKLTADRLGLAIGNPVTYCLTQTTILACLTSLQKAGEASISVVDNRLVWRPA